MWVCPKCGKWFVNRNNWHSCSRWPLSHHFGGRPAARKLFDRFRAVVEAIGPVRLVSNKTKVGFMARVRFAGCEPRKDGLRCGMWLKRRVRSRRWTRVEFIPPDNYMHMFDVRGPRDFDAEIKRYLREAYDVGMQRHLIGRTSARGAGAVRRGPALRDRRRSSGRKGLGLRGAS